jgi:hypothetical protein
MTGVSLFAGIATNSAALSIELSLNNQNKGVVSVAEIQMFLCNRSENVFQLEQIFEVYINEIEPLFIFDDTRRDDFIKKKVEATQHYDHEGTPYDLEDIYSNACELLYQREKMLYQHRCFTIVQLYSAFEQQVRRNFREEIMRGGFVTNTGDKYSYKEFNLDRGFGHLEKCLVSIESAEKGIWWDKDLLDEIRLLNNAIKHGFGGSFDRFLKQFPHLINAKFCYEELPFEEFFSSGFKPLAQSTLFDEVFLLSSATLKSYKNALVDFWLKNEQGNFYLKI